MGLSNFFPPFDFRESVGVDVPAGVLWRIASSPEEFTSWNSRFFKFRLDREAGSGEVRQRTLAGGTLVYMVKVEEPKEKREGRVLLEQRPSRGFVRHARMIVTTEPVGRFSRATLEVQARFSPFFLRRVAGALASAYHSRALMRLKEQAEASVH